MSTDDSQDGENRFRRSPTGPAVAPPRIPPGRAPTPPVQLPWHKRHFWTVVIFILLVAGVAIRAYRDLSQPEAWDYWKDQYVSPGLTSQVIDTLHLDGSSRGRRALFISGTIGPAAANWFRGSLDQANLAAGDIVLLASPGGDLNQAAIMGEIIRSRSLATAVGSADASGRVKPGYCASACVLVYAGGKARFGVLGSALGVHRFVTTRPVDDPVAEAQRVSGAVLGYMTKMGVSSSIVEAMSETREIRWLSPKQALAMNLVTEPLGKP
ncbi:hypothetical protein [Bradyrhizobium valentinum]|uniref:Clp protease n=1 Tax=Bradyrhizobium valentinum TaxID=1518501 RepID=A0A0R3KL49_9BRAD|nr:hypothetical protein [Bradyrhizobium valentinum]KRQ92879.1 hypothetical protein CP49_28540 [Bradyrhizobium valentinum]KRR13155.1 hypothetical protein CQ10_09820 [Bradyrhizobium valentinum]